MAFTPFNFTKSWRNASDFPTFEPDEGKVRDDMQSLFDELKAGLNRLIGELKASNMPFTPTAEVDSADVQNAIENVQSQISAAIIGQLPDGSVTETKLAGSAVTEGKISDGAVTAAKIGASAVETAKIADEAVTAAKIADATLTADKLADGAVTSDKLSDEAKNAKADLVNGKVRPNQLSRARVNVTASRSLSVDDDGKILYAFSDSALTLTLPLNSVAQLPIGCEIEVYRAGTGSVTFAAAEGVTLCCADALNALRQYGTARLKKWEANVWSVELDCALADGAVTNAKLGNGAVTNAKLGNGSVTAPKIAANAVTTVYHFTVTPAMWMNETSTNTCLCQGQPIEGMDENSEFLIDLEPRANGASIAEGLARAAAWRPLEARYNSSGLFLRMVGSSPTIDIPIKIMAIRK